MKHRGFTLIELLIVLVIVGIMVILAIPQYEKMVYKMHAVEAKTVVRALSDAMWRAYLETGSFDFMLGDDYTPYDLGFDDSSRYYSYQFGYNSSLGSPYYMLWRVEAWHKFMTPGDAGPLPKGIIAAYGIGFSKDAPQGNEQVEKMDHEWYRYYYCIKEGQWNDTIFKWL